MAGQTKRKGMGRRITYSALMVLWLLILPIFALAMGFSGFLPLSPLGLVEDMAALPAAWRDVSLRLLCWLYLIWPVATYYLLLGRRRAKA